MVEKRNFYIILSSSVFLILAVIVFILSMIYPIRASPEELYTCNTLQFSSPNAINLVFFSTEAEATEYSEYLLNSEPFSEFSENFNVYFIDSFLPECEIYRGVAFLCYSREVLRAAASCPNDYIYVLKDGDSSIRSSAYRNVISVNLRHPLSVILHETGHAMFNFAEEYIPGEIPPLSKNCQETCENFDGEIDGCFIGCSDNSHSRSVEAGVMRTLSSEDYGIYNDNLIRAEIERQSQISESAITGNAISEIDDCKNSVHDSVIVENGEIVGKIRTVGCPSENKNVVTPYLFTDAPKKTNLEILEMDGFTYIDPKIPTIVQIPEGETSTSLEVVDSEGKIVDKQVDLSKIQNIYASEYNIEFQFPEIEKETNTKENNLVDKVAVAIVGTTFGKTYTRPKPKNILSTILQKNSIEISEFYAIENGIDISSISPENESNNSVGGLRIYENSPWTGSVISELKENSGRNFFFTTFLLLVVLLIFFNLSRNN